MHLVSYFKQGWNLKVVEDGIFPYIMSRCGWPTLGHFHNNMAKQGTLPSRLRGQILVFVFLCCRA